MLRLTAQGMHLCDGVTRREWLRLGSLGLGGLTLPTLLRARAEGAETGHPATAKSVIVLFNSGGMPQHETWDPKPEAPKEVRGDFGVISTKTPGLFVGELMPKLAQLTDRIAVIRSMVTGDNAHSTSGYQMLTGVPHVPLNRENAGPGKPNDWPSLNALVQALRPTRGGLPASIALPRKMANNNGQDPWPGTDAGFLGRKVDPWFLVCNPNEENFTMPGGEFLDGMAQARFDSRLSLMQQLRQPLDQLERQATITDYSNYQQQALELIAGGSARQAFDIEAESPETRERYTRTHYGQSVLLARRLIEAGVSLVQVQSVSEDKNRPNGGGWDTHTKHSESLKGWLMPTFDQVTSTLILDLEERGLLDETLVCMVTEFGHTPKFNKREGRDHWGRVFSIALAGGGIRGGIVHGASDRNAAEPALDPVQPCDYLATVFHCLGFAPDTIVHDVEGRPLPISRGKVLDGLLA
ncbi:MAG: DUF1501 domain-containing protein [Planctomycetaceae bacterium]|nr:DUF1501 domain-containing protein [Planctomycetaceae bacterium]